MKKLFYIALTAVVAIAGQSCEDALERLPKDSLSPETFFSNEEECRLFTNDFYTMFPKAGIYNETADIIAKNSLTDEVNGTRVVPSTASTWTWDRLRDINFYLAHSSNCSDAGVRAEYDGVARFFRAWFYFEKVKYYGDVPWVDKPLSDNSEELYKGRDSREVIMQHIIEDLDYAIEYLPSAKHVYRVTRWTAMALKSRACLFEGTFRKYHGIENADFYLQECANISRRFITESGYTLYTEGETPYFDLFESLNAKDSEIILARAFNGAIGLTHELSIYLTSPTYGRPGLLKNIANMYLMKDGTPFTSQIGYDEMVLADECKNRDKRFAQTLRTPGYKRVGQTQESAPNLGESVTGYQLIKYLGDPKFDAYNTSENDLPIYRTAEVYLNYAEALAELGTLTQSELDITINLLRDRAGVAHLNMADANANPDPYLLAAETGYPNVTKSANTGVILEIRRERTVELLMEGLRYWDIMRWKEGKRFEHDFTGLYFPGPGEYDLNSDGVIDLCLHTGNAPATSAPIVYELNKDLFLTNGTSGNILTNIDYPRKWDENRDYLYPVPTDDRVLTSGAITQNPGWIDNLNF